ncbi:large conductance mechanosensitive channel protein MscL [Falsiroseomonas selenitidurans]|uniref:Large-conductance mechanosensitive channel n=1 Tax=Falsiroseomonas selenitidurans TaxID=2716335 RepID=A0ABX1E0Z0_9PROT|nr:large conductance mechanosensitive channel protein MscL [Falsiroseomonas selenitidurans]NKC30826.1 large conductance mechanosensitive channel protein MscL [Falsiroseomonas selenitidurans]
MKSPIPLAEPTWLSEFKAFIMRGSVIDLAVGIVIGAAFTAIVSSLVEDLINPLIGLLVGGIDFSNVFVVLSGTRQATLEATRESGAAVLAVGRFINAIIKFLIVALAIFWLLKALTRLRVRQDAVKGPSSTDRLLAQILEELRSNRPTESMPAPTTPPAP